MNIQNRNSPKRLLGAFAKILLVGIVMTFLGLQSINFFSFTFPPDQWYYAYLGFGLTSLGVLFYLVVLKMDADTALKRTVAAVMMIVCVIGEIVTAGAGMQVEGWKNMNYAMTPDDFKFMIIAVQVLGIAHGLALILYFAGDDLFSLFRDDDRDGIPNLFDRDYQPRPYSSETRTNHREPASQDFHQPSSRS